MSLSWRLDTPSLRFPTASRLLNLDRNEVSDTTEPESPCSK
jgi:hypothetical protein